MSEIQLADDIKRILAAATVSGTHLTLTSELDRPTYVRVNKAIQTMGGVWNRRAACHVFEEDASAIVGDAIATGLVIDLKKQFQFFETPPTVAHKLVDYAQLKPNMSVLEPSAGKGAIVRQIMAAGVKNVSACESWDKNITALKKTGVNIIASDFLKLGGHTFDRVIANPPFTRGQEIMHVQKMVSVTAPGGRVVSVMTPGWTFRMDHLYATFRSKMEALGADWYELPDDSFASSGTNVKVGIIVINLPK